MLRVLCIFLVIVLCSAKELRSLNAQLNPNCPPVVCMNNDESTITVVHISAVGEHDTLHYLWDFTGKPSVLIALTSPITNLTINWENFILNDPENSVIFSTKPIYTSTVVMNRLWQFNDAEDTGTFSYGVNSSEINVYDTRYITWTRNEFRKSVHEVEVTVKGDNLSFFGDGRISLNFKCFASVDHGIDFPHLLHSENSTQFDLVFDGLQVNSSFKNPRFAAEFIFVSEESRFNNQSFMLHSKKSLDDEHTPGIFEIVEIASPKSLMANKGSFIQYRPVSYTHPERDVSTSTELHITMPTNLDNPTIQLNTSLAWLYYGPLLNTILVQGFNVSFGMSGDGFYTKTNYSTWTFIMGYGTPPNEQLSMFVVIVASIGLGIPLILLVGGGCYICIKRTRNR
ncbi:Glycosylated lysosomal membrane protein [Pseudolycoriella hygida]|uniref:Glycosylated lysosomal membrane protein n=1 Tax=Pseudolycoriella hygida TaxID=35572 RepID=A0A9Q0MQ68_9DIPT|nr:Glycosylated lysosomal membrane protein [Pseudolycoriella hygida]